MNVVFVVEAGGTRDEDSVLVGVVGVPVMAVQRMKRIGWQGDKDEKRSQWWCGDDAGDGSGTGIVIPPNNALYLTLLVLYTGAVCFLTQLGGTSSNQTDQNKRSL